MTYFELTKVKARHQISPAETGYDITLNDLGAQSDSDIDQMLYDVATKSNRLTSLPALPLSSPPQSIKDASTDLTIASYFAVKERKDMHDLYRKRAIEAVNQYISRLHVDAEIYGRII